MTYTSSSPVFARALLTPAAFRSVLIKRSSPAVAESNVLSDVLMTAGVDPAVFLGQFAAESSYGTSGYARTTKSPGNIVISRPLLPHWTLAFGGRPWKAPNGRTYAKFSTWRDGTRAYAALLKTYRLRGWATSIATMASHWLGMADATHSGYVHNIVTHANFALPTGSSLPPTPPAPDLNPYPVGSIEYVLYEHEHGRSVPPKPVTPPTIPVPPAPPISLMPTTVPAMVSYAEPQTGDPVVLGPYLGLRFGTAGPVFVLVHGGPVPLGAPSQLAELGWRLAARGARAFAIDYRSDTWQNAVGDVEVAIANVRKLVGGPITLVSHSFGGLPSLVAALRDGAVEAYASVDSSVRTSYPDFPDAVELAKLRPRLPVSVIRGQGDVTGAEGREEFIAALNAAGHPGLNVMGPGDHSGTLLTDATLDAILATAALI